MSLCWTNPPQTYQVLVKWVKFSLTSLKSAWITKISASILQVEHYRWAAVRWNDGLTKWLSALDDKDKNNFETECFTLKQELHFQAILICSSALKIHWHWRSLRQKRSDLLTLGNTTNNRNGLLSCPIAQGAKESKTLAIVACVFVDKCDANYASANAA